MQVTTEKMNAFARYLRGKTSVAGSRPIHSVEVSQQDRTKHVRFKGTHGRGNYKGAFNYKVVVVRIYFRHDHRKHPMDDMRGQRKVMKRMAQLGRIYFGIPSSKTEVHVLFTYDERPKSRLRKWWDNWIGNL